MDPYSYKVIPQIATTTADQRRLLPWRGQTLSEKMTPLQLHLPHVWLTLTKDIERTLTTAVECA